MKCRYVLKKFSHESLPCPFWVGKSERKRLLRGPGHVKGGVKKVGFEGVDRILVRCSPVTNLCGCDIEPSCFMKGGNFFY